jgi:hypothetical protein
VLIGDNEMGKNTAKYFAIYKQGHPNIKEQNINTYIILREDGLEVRKAKLLCREGEILFSIPYEKIASANFGKEMVTNTAAIVGFGLIGAALAGKKKNEQIEINVKGKDKDGKDVNVIILFDEIVTYGAVNNPGGLELKGKLDQEIGRINGITI